MIDPATQEGRTELRELCKRTTTPGYSVSCSCPSCVEQRLLRTVVPALLDKLAEAEKALEALLDKWAGDPRTVIEHILARIRSGGKENT